MFRMNNRDKEGKRRKKNKRKVILLRYDDTKESLVLTKTVREKKETLKIEIHSNTAQSVKKVIYTQNDKTIEKYPLFRAQLKKRIVPCCSRDKCREAIDQKGRQCRRYNKGMNTEQKSRGHVRKQKEASPPIIIIDDDDDQDTAVLQYDDVSSGSLSSCSDDEIESLMKSTRKRMRDSDEEWKLIPRRMNLINTIPAKRLRSSSRSASLNSLDTLILEEDAKSTRYKSKENNVLNSANLSEISKPESQLKSDPLEGIKNTLNKTAIHKSEQYFHNKDYKQKSKRKKGTYRLNKTVLAQINIPGKIIATKHLGTIKTEVKRIDYNKLEKNYNDQKVEREKSNINRQINPDLPQISRLKNKIKLEKTNNNTLKETITCESIQPSHEKGLNTLQLNNEDCSLIGRPEKRIKLEPRKINTNTVEEFVICEAIQSLHCNDYHNSKNKTGIGYFNQSNNDLFSPINLSEKRMKLEALETSNNTVKQIATDDHSNEKEYKNRKITRELNETNYFKINTPNRIIKSESQETKTVEHKSTNKSKQNIISINRTTDGLKTADSSHIINIPEAKNKSEPLESNTNTVQQKAANESKQNSYDNDFNQNNDQITDGLKIADSSPIIIPKKKTELEPLESNNNTVNYTPFESGKSKMDYFQRNEGIDAVITKLERNDIDPSDLNVIDIKQELYSDI